MSFTITMKLSNQDAENRNFELQKQLMTERNFTRCLVILSGHCTSLSTLLHKVKAKLFTYILLHYDTYSMATCCKLQGQSNSLTNAE